MATLSPGELVFFALVIVLSYAIRGSSGFGGVTVPLLALILSLKTVVPVVTVLGLISSWSILAHDRRHVAWRVLWRIAPWSLLGALLGLYFFRTLDASTLTRALGVVVVAYGAYSGWITFRPPATARGPLRFVTEILGLVAGFVGTLFGAMAGMFFAIYLDLQRLAKNDFRATAAAILLGLGLVRAGGYIAVGAFDRDALVACAAALPLMALGIFAGNRLHANLDPLQFRRFVALVLIGSGIPLLLR